MVSRWIQLVGAVLVVLFATVLFYLPWGPDEGPDQGEAPALSGCGGEAGPVRFFSTEGVDQKLAVAHESCVEVWSSYPFARLRKLSVPEGDGPARICALNYLNPRQLQVALTDGRVVEWNHRFKTQVWRVGAEVGERQFSACAISDTGAFFWSKGGGLISVKPWGEGITKIPGVQARRLESVDRNTLVALGDKGVQRIALDTAEATALSLPGGFTQVVRNDNAIGALYPYPEGGSRILVWSLKTDTINAQAVLPQTKPEDVHTMGVYSSAIWFLALKDRLALWESQRYVNGRRPPPTWSVKHESGGVYAGFNTAGQLLNGRDEVELLSLSTMAPAPAPPMKWLDNPAETEVIEGQAPTELGGPPTLGAVHTALVSPDEEALVVSAERGLMLKAITGGSWLLLDTPTDAPLMGIRFDSKGDKLIACDRAGNVATWDTASWKLRWWRHGASKGERVKRCVISDDGLQMVLRTCNRSFLHDIGSKESFKVASHSDCEGLDTFADAGTIWQIGRKKFERFDIATRTSAPLLLKETPTALVSFMDGRRALMLKKRRAVLWDMKEGRRLALYGEQSERSTALALSGDKRLVAVAAENNVRTFETRTATLGHELRTDLWNPSKLTLSATGRFVAALEEGRFRFWDLSEPHHTHPTPATPSPEPWSPITWARGADEGPRPPSMLKRLPGGPVSDAFFHSSVIEAVALSRSGQRLASGDALGVVKVWDLDDVQLLTTFQSDAPGVSGLAFSAEDQLVVMDTKGGVVRLDVETGEVGWRHEGSDDRHHLVLSADGRHAAYESGGRKVARGCETVVVEVGSAVFRTDCLDKSRSKGLFLAGKPARLHAVASKGLWVWDFKTDEVTRNTQFVGQPSVPVVVGRGGNLALINRIGGGTAIWDMSEPARSRLRAEAGSPGLALSGDEGRLVLFDGKTHVVEARTGRAVRVLDVGAQKAALSFDGQRLAVVQGGRVRVFGVDDGAEHHPPRVPWGNLSRLVTSKGNRSLISDLGGSVHTLDMASGEVGCTLRCGGKPIWVGLSPDGAVGVCHLGGALGLQLFDTATCGRLGHLKAKSSNKMVFMDDGHTLATSPRAGGERWDLRTGQKRLDMVEAIEVSAGGLSVSDWGIATATSQSRRYQAVFEAKDRTLRIVRVSDEKTLARTRIKPTEKVREMAFTGDGRHLAVVLESGEVARFRLR